jgi:DNA-binding transcriptional LysR family regulator
MELRQLEYFVAVAEEANFTRAAERVHISQSGVSAQIRQLERELGAELIDRSTRTARVTVAGAAALGPARAALTAAAALRDAVDEVNDLVRGQVAVAMVAGCTLTPLFDALAAFHRTHPGVELTLSEDSSERMVEQVRAGLVDVALVGCAGTPPADLDSIPIVSEGLAVLVPAGHPLSTRPAVPLAELVTHPLVCLPGGTGIRTVLERACERHGLQPVVALQASAPEAVADLARRGLGVAVLSESMTAQLDRDLVRVPVTGVDLPAVLALVWRPIPNPALGELLRRCETTFGKLRMAAGQGARET